MKRHKRTTTLRGQVMTLKEVAEELGQPYLRVWQRVCLGRETGDDIERNPSQKRPGTRKKKIIECDGLKLTTAEWAERLGCNENTIRNRMRRHGSPYRVVGGYVMEGNKTMAQLAADHGITYGALRGRVNRGETVEQALGPYRTNHNRSLIAVDGVLRKKEDVMREAGVSRQLLSDRLRKGWTLVDAASTPPHRRGWKRRLFEYNADSVEIEDDGPVFTPKPGKKYTERELMAVVYGMKNLDEKQK